MEGWFQISVGNPYINFSFHKFVPIFFYARIFQMAPRFIIEVRPFESSPTATAYAIAKRRSHHCRVSNSPSGARRERIPQAIEFAEANVQIEECGTYESVSVGLSQGWDPVRRSLQMAWRAATRRAKL